MIRMVLTSALMLLVLASTAFSQFAFDFTGTGARAQGMGNAFIAVSNDASSASWNPAGLTVHEKVLMGFDFDSYSPDNKFDDGFSLFKENPSFSSVSQLSIVVPLRFRGRPMVFGLSYGKVFQEYWNDGTRTTGTYYNQALGIERDSSEMIMRVISDEHPNLQVLNIAVGSKLGPRVSVGAAVNIYSGQNVANAFVETVIPHYTNDPLGGDQYVYHEESIEIIDSAKYSGTNFTFGAKYEGEKIDFGLMVRTPFDLKSESDFKLNFRTVENGLLHRVGSDTVYIDNILIKYGVPWIIGLGVAAHPTEAITLATDFEYRGFSGEQVKVRDSIHIDPGSSNEEFYSVHDVNNNNALSIRAGFEYNWETGNETFPTIPLRLGFSSTSLVASNRGITFQESGNVDVILESVLSPIQLDDANVTNFHLGLGVKWSQIYLDAAVTFSTVDLPSSVPNPDPLLPDISVGSWDNSSTSFMFGFTGYF